MLQLCGSLTCKWGASNFCVGYHASGPKSPKEKKHTQMHTTRMHACMHTYNICAYTDTYTHIHTYSHIVQHPHESFSMPLLLPCISISCQVLPTFVIVSISFRALSLMLSTMASGLIGLSARRAAWSANCTEWKTKSKVRTSLCNLVTTSSIRFLLLFLLLLLLFFFFLSLQAKIHCS